jgi:hypothetical protein
MTKHSENTEPSNSTKPVLSEVYDMLLNNFVSHEQNYFVRPFIIDNLVIASDKNTLIFFDKSLATDGYVQCEENTRKSVLNIMPNERNDNFKISVAELQKAFDENKCAGFIKCDACKGSGSVEYEFEYKLKTYSEEIDCPVCDGLREQSTLNDFSIDIKNCRFTATNINQLLFTAKKLNEEFIELVYQTLPDKPNVFKIKDVEILSMVKMKYDNDNVILNLA